MNNLSYYLATNRNRISDRDKLSTFSNYSFNYLKYMPVSKTARILDVGCSEGVSLSWLSELNHSDITGIDSDQDAIKIAQERLENQGGTVTIKCVDALSFLSSCQDNSFDMVLMFNVIEHIPKDKIIAVISEIKRVLTCDGLFLTQTGNWENPLNIGLFTRDFTHEVMYTTNSLRQLMLMTGFSSSNIIIRPVGYKTTLRNLPLQLTSIISGIILKAIALSMRCYIRETSPLIYCIARKS